MRSCKVSLTPRVEEDIDAILDYLTAQRGRDLARLVHRWLEMDLRRLGQDALCFRELEEKGLEASVRKAPVWVWRGNRRRRRTSWVIYYGVEENPVTVFRVRHSRQRWFWEED